MATSKKSVKSSAPTQNNYIMISPAEIFVDEKLNPREDYGNIDELKNSIIENGLRNSLKCFIKDGKILLREGFRRMRAINIALKEGKKIERVPVIMDKRVLTAEERTLEFLINNDGKPFTMLEQSIVIKELLNYGWKVTEIVKRTGKARGYIENLIALSQIPKKIENYIKEGKISAHAVLQIIAANKGDEAKLLADVEEAIKSAVAAGKSKATPKHVKTQKVKKQSFGKFYKFAIEIAEALSLRDDAVVARKEVLEHILVAFENGRSAKQVLESYFVIKNTKNSPTKTKVKKTAKKTAKNTPGKKKNNK